MNSCMYVCMYIHTPCAYMVCEEAGKRCQNWNGNWCHLEQEWQTVIYELPDVGLGN